MRFFSQIRTCPFWLLLGNQLCFYQPCFPVVTADRAGKQLYSLDCMLSSLPQSLPRLSAPVTFAHCFNSVSCMGPGSISIYHFFLLSLPVRAGWTSDHRPPHLF